MRIRNRKQHENSKHKREEKNKIYLENNNNDDQKNKRQRDRRRNNQLSSCNPFNRALRRPYVPCRQFGLLKATSRSVVYLDLDRLLMPLVFEINTSVRSECVRVCDFGIAFLLISEGISSSKETKTKEANTQMNRLMVFVCVWKGPVGRFV